MSELKQEFDAVMAQLTATGAPFGLHNLEINVRGRGTTLHGIRFGTADVPDVP